MLFTRESLTADATRRGARDAQTRRPIAPPMRLDLCEAYWSGYRSVPKSQRKSQRHNRTGAQLWPTE